MKYYILIISLLLTACKISTNNTAQIRAQDREKIGKELGGEVSLSADRSKLDELRKEIPEEKKKAKETERQPEFVNREGAMKHLMKHDLKEVFKDLEDTYGEITTYARAATHSEGGRGPSA
jgi:molybdopterin converting factor small subunit